MDRPAKPKILIIANISTVPDTLLSRLHMFEVVTTAKTNDLEVLNKEIVTVIDSFKHILMIDTAILKLSQVATSLGKWHRENPDGAFIVGGGLSMFCFNLDRIKRLFRALDLNWCVGGITYCESVLHLTPGKFPPSQWPSALPGPTFYLNNVASADKRYISRTSNDLYAAVAHRGTVMWLGFPCEHQGYTELALSLIARCMEGDCDNSSQNGWHELGSQQTFLELEVPHSMEITEQASIKGFSSLVKTTERVEDVATVKDDTQSAYQREDAHDLSEDKRLDPYEYEGTWHRLEERYATESAYCTDTEDEITDQEIDEHGENTDKVDEGQKEWEVFTLGPVRRGANAFDGSGTGIGTPLQARCGNKGFRA